MRSSVRPALRSLAALGILGLVCGAGVSCSAGGREEEAPPVVRASGGETSIPSPKTLACGTCHAEEMARWAASQHASANRLVSPDKDAGAFEAEKSFEEPGRRASMRTADGRFEISISGASGAEAIHEPKMVIGIEPLREYLIPFPGGRFQVLDIAHDPARKDWFGIYPGEHRQPHEWGFWTNRGHNWNAQCAVCHMTGLVKGYDPAKDAYNTTWDEMGVSCAQCHGPMAGHAESGKRASGETGVPRERIMDNCAACHARREELTGAFKPGDSFDDHYRLTLVDAPGIYHPDGQVLDEDFEYGSFMMSRMAARGVTCLDCHDPHSGKLRIPKEGNVLCMSCHAAPGTRGAKPVDPREHGRHEVWSRGAACVGCHMPETTYMARDPRRDHGFTSPDPLLTKELGIPNACNRCHEDRSVDWAVEWADKWYGVSARGASRKRARVVARAREGDPAVLPDLLDLARNEPIPAWRAGFTALLAPWSDRREVSATLLGSLADESPLVRSSAVRAIEGMAVATPAIRSLLSDPVRLVRLDATLGLIDVGERLVGNRAELESYLTAGADQPAGALRRARVAMAEGRPEEAAGFLRAALDWDPGSPVLLHALGRALNAAGKNDEARGAFEEAERLEPESAVHPYMLGLLHAERGRLDEAAAALERAVGLEPGFGRAWYNLGLARAELNRLPEALEALEAAGTLMPESPDPPYARAGLLDRMGDVAGARAAMASAEELRQRLLESSSP